MKARFALTCLLSLFFASAMPIGEVAAQSLLDAAEIKKAFAIIDGERKDRRAYVKTAIQRKDKSSTRKSKISRRERLAASIEGAHRKLAEWSGKASVALKEKAASHADGQWGLASLGEVEGRRLYALAWSGPDDPETVKYKDALSWKLVDSSGSVLEHRQFEFERGTHSVLGRRLLSFPIKDGTKPRFRRPSDVRIKSFRVKLRSGESPGRFGGRRGGRKRVSRPKQRRLNRMQSAAMTEIVAEIYRLRVVNGGWVGANRRERLETTALSLMAMHRRSRFATEPKWKPIIEANDLRSYRRLSASSGVHDAALRLLREWPRIKKSDRSLLGISLHDLVVLSLLESWIRTENPALEIFLKEQVAARLAKSRPLLEPDTMAKADLVEAASNLLVLWFAHQAAFDVSPADKTDLATAINARRNRTTGRFSDEPGVHALVEFAVLLGGAPVNEQTWNQSASWLAKRSPPLPSAGKKVDWMLTCYGTEFLYFYAQPESWETWFSARIEPLAQELGNSRWTLAPKMNEVTSNALAMMLVQRGYNVHKGWPKLKREPEKGK